MPVCALTPSPSSPCPSLMTAHSIWKLLVSTAQNATAIILFSHAYMCVVMCLDGSQPVRYGVKLELDDKYRRLKEVISELSGIPFANLRLVEVYGAMVKVHTLSYTMDI